jgi:hypothetical protein
MGLPEIPGTGIPWPIWSAAALGGPWWAGGRFKVYVLTLLMLCGTRMKPLLSERVRTWDVLLLGSGLARRGQRILARANLAVTGQWVCPSEGQNGPQMNIH